LGFSRNIKDQILVDTARHCCVCHRYKGVKVEVHHIKQEALGGANTYDNAIALCFDCHADAGHYNPKHPRGTKFSPSELMRAKNQWIELVRTNDVKKPSEPDAFLCQYFVCENYENLSEIVNGDLSKFPVEKPLLIKNRVLKYLSNINESHPESYRHANAWGECHKSAVDYLSKYPESVVTKEIRGEYAYFELVRTPTRAELDNYSQKDGVLKLMLEADMPIKNVSAIVGCYEHACWGEGLHEEYIFRKLWCSFAAITNISSQPLSLDSIDACIDISGGFSEFQKSTNDIEQIALPKMPISPGTTVVLPIAILLPPLYSLSKEEWSSTSSGGLNGQVQVVSHGSMTSKSVSETLTYGEHIQPQTLRFKKGGNLYIQQFHSFDLTNMYSIDRDWQCGSCPHLFFKRDEVIYKRELLTHCEFELGEDCFIVPEGIQSVIIAEIEDETTEIHTIMVNGEVYATDLKLNKSEYIEIPTHGLTEIKIVGRYIPYGPSNKDIPQGIKRNDLVGNFLFRNGNWPNNSVQGIPVLARLHP